MTGDELIADERMRQITTEGYSLRHDDEHDDGGLIRAAIAYAMHAESFARPSPVIGWFAWWPWQRIDWKPSPTPIRDLVKAGALIAAEIDRLQRFEREVDRLQHIDSVEADR